MSAYPSMSVVICTRDRPIALLRCLQSVVAQTVRPLEIIIVDDGRLTPEFQAALRCAADQAGVRCLYLRKEAPGLTASRNLGVRCAQGEIVQFLDDDVTLAPDFCEQILALYRDDAGKEVLGADGVLIAAGANDWGGRCFELLYRVAGWWALQPPGVRRPLPACLRDHRRAWPNWRIVGATMSFRREALLDAGFDESLSGYALGEDRDLALRLWRVGWIARCRLARAEHHHEPASRPKHFSFGMMVVRNYWRIQSNAGMNRIGDRLVSLYSLLTIALGVLAASILRPRRYLPEFAGMAAGAAGLALEALRRLPGQSGTPRQTSRCLSNAQPIRL